MLTTLTDDDFSDLEGELDDDDDNDEDMDTDMSAPHSPPCNQPSSNDTSTGKLSGRHSLNHTSARHPSSYVDHEPANQSPSHHSSLLLVQLSLYLTLHWKFLSSFLLPL